MTKLKFKVAHRATILSGDKTETRRNFPTALPQLGSQLDAVDGEGDSIATIRITGLRLQKVCEFTDEDALREGYNTHSDLWEQLMHWHNGELPLQKEMVAIRFEVVT